MTVPQIKVKIQRRPVVKLKVLPKFPSSVTGEGGIEVENVGGNYVISPTLGVIGDVVGPGSSASVAGQLAVFTDGNHIEGGGVGAGALAVVFATLALAEAATIPAVVDVVPIYGYADPGDGGGAEYKRSASEPSHPGKFQSDDGAWWEIADQTLNVRMFGAVGDGSTNDSPAFDDAIETALALDKREVVVPGGGSYVTFTTVDLDDTVDFTLRGEGATESAITYPGAGAAISARSSVRCRITGLNIVASEAARVIDFRTNVGNTSSPLVDHCVIQHINIGNVASRIGLDFNDNESVSVKHCSIGIADAIGIQGVTGGANFVIGATISDNVFSDQTAVNHIKASSNSWLIERNEIEIGTGPVIAKGAAGTSSQVTLIGNWIGDAIGVQTIPLVTSNSHNLISIGNTYATSIGGGGSSTCIEMDSAAGGVISGVYSCGDWLSADVGIAIGTGNYLKIVTPNKFLPPTTLFTGTPANSDYAEVTGGPINVVGRVDSGKAGAVVGAYRLYNATSGYVELTVASPGALGNNSITVPAINGDTLVGASATQTLTNKTLGNTNIITARDDRFTLQDSGDTTKQAVFELSGIATATTRTYTLPNASDTLVGKATTDTLTNKTYDTAGTGNSFSINGVAVTANTGTGAVVRASSPSIASLSVTTSLSVTGTNGTSNNANSTSTISLTNSDAGTSAAAAFQVGNGTATFQFGMRGLNQSAYGMLAANTAFMYGAVDVNFMSDGGAFKFATGGNSETARFTTGKGFAIGTTTDPGAGAILANASIKSQSATAGIGYATGAGGTVTQTVGKTASVTLDKITGQITMHNANMAAGAHASFQFNNSSIAATDVVVVNIKSGASFNSYTVGAEQMAAGTCIIHLWNTTAGALAEAVVLQYVVIKGVNA